MTKIKICGITSYEDAANAAKLGADYIGFNFYAKSPRYIKASRARKIIEKLPKKVKKVGVFVNSNFGNIKDIARLCRLDLVQLSGNEDNGHVSKLKKTLGTKIIKTFRIKKMADIKNIKGCKADYIMLDSFKKGFFGGTGIKINLKFAGKLDSRNLFLAGGLNAANIRSIIRKINPYAVDVCSGIESYPGKKGFGKMKSFIEAAR
ncbi:phosphoribosylanthranilate isomerase [Candidatus Woesearchaeota archaeon]|nr:phosphoribosylanthranilate isomerase [Candidatus Woesearchaeota archaeon]